VHRTRKEWAELAAAVIGLGGLLFTVFSYVQTQKAEQRARNLETLMKAAELMGDDQGASTRSGAIVTLGQLGHEGPFEQHQLSLFLEHFVRDHATNKERSEASAKSKDWPTVDIRAALEILASISSTAEPGQHSENPKIDFHGVCLQGADLSFLHVVYGWDLSGADLSRANLNGTTFTYCRFSATNFSHVQFEDGRIEKCDLCDAKFVGADLLRTSISNCPARTTNFDAADINFGALVSDNLYSATFERAKVADTDFGGSDLRNVSLAHIEMPSRPLYQLAQGDNSTILPSAFKRPRSW